MEQPIDPTIIPVTAPGVATALPVPYDSSNPLRRAKESQSVSGERPRAERPRAGVPARACPYNTGSHRHARLPRPVPSVSHHPLLNIAIRAARKAGDVIARNIDRSDTFTVSEKATNDLVTEIDRFAERRIIDTVRRSHPDHAFLAEESGAHGHGDFEWIIDPLDGTTNFVHGFPHVAVSIAVRRRGRIEHAVVFDPLRQELFTASRGSGARLDDRRIRVAAKSSLKGALLGTGLPSREIGRLDPYLATLKALISGSAQIRRSGSAALDLAYVAAGRLDGFWEIGLAPWDVAAGALLVQEAGGIVSEPDGGDDYLRSGDVAAANPKVLRAMLRTIGPRQPGRALADTVAGP